jgi:hypothetical protein
VQNWNRGFQQHSRGSNSCHNFTYFEDIFGDGDNTEEHQKVEQPDEEFFEEECCIEFKKSKEGGLVKIIFGGVCFQAKKQLERFYQDLRHFVTTYTQKFTNAHDVDFLKIPNCLSSKLLNVYAAMKMAPNTEVDCEEEMSTSVTGSIKNLRLAKFKAKIEASATVIVQQIIRAQGKDVLSLYQSEDEDDLALEKIEEILKDVEAGKFTRNDLKKLLKATIKPTPDERLNCITAVDEFKHYFEVRSI